jgi:hypothetical protein
MPTLTHNFLPQQTVYVITNCDAALGGQRSPTSGLLISNSQFPGAPDVQVSPVMGNDILVREGVVQEFRSSVYENPSNADAQLTVEILGGEVVSADVRFAGAGYFPDAYAAAISITTTAGEITGVTIDDPGMGYTDGVGFTINITDPALRPGAGLIGRISYDVVDGMLTNAAVDVPGTGYVDGSLGVGFASTNIPYPAGALTVALTTTAGGTTGTQALLVVEIVDGAVANVDIANGGSGYTDSPAALVTDMPPADANRHEFIYLIRLTDNRQNLYVQVPVGFDGVEQQGDIFATLTAAVDEYEARIST